MWRDLAGLVPVLAALMSPAGAGEANVAPESSLQVHLETRGTAEGAELDVLVRAQADALSDAEPEVRTVTLVQGSADLLLPLAPSSDWTIQVLAAGYWSPVTKMSSGSTPAIEIPLWEAAQLNAEVVSPSGTPDVEELHLRLFEVSYERGAGNEEAVESWETFCAVDERRVEACPVPAGVWDLRIDASDFAPIHLWGRTFRPGQSRDLGKLFLVRGGTLSGRVLTEEGPADPHRAKVELLPLVDRGTLPEADKRRLEQVTRTAQVNEWGYFQFVGVPSGAFEIRAEQPGFGPAGVSPVRVEDGELLEIKEPLILKRPFRISTFIEPAVGPFDSGWTVELVRASGSDMLEPVATGRTDRSGFWESPPVTGGRYVIRVLDDDGNSMAWEEREIPPESETVSIELPLVYVEGTVLLGEEPLEARLWFGGRSGDERIEAASDEEGSFFVILPREGMWSVDVSAESPPVNSRGKEVEVEPIEGLRTAELLVEIPDTSVAGEVVDEAGLPPQGPVRVGLISLGEWKGILDATPDNLGQFELRGMPPGLYYLQAEASGKRSSTEQVVVAEGATPFARLVLQDDLAMAGRVVSSSGPVPGALVVVYPFAADGRLGRVSPVTGRTSVDGSFRIQVPGNSHDAQVMVLAPGYSFYVTRVTKGSSGRHVLSGNGWGTLHLPSPSFPGEASESVGFVMVNGAPIGLPRLAAWSRLNGVHDPSSGDAMMIPAMPSGDYARCRVTVEEALAVLSGVALPASGACTGGFLGPGGELTLEAP